MHEHHQSRLQFTSERVLARIAEKQRELMARHPELSGVEIMTSVTIQQSRLDPPVSVLFVRTVAGVDFEIELMEGDCVPGDIILIQ